jgi:hypothetical protein
MTSAPVAEVKAMQDAYHALCESLLDASDYQTIGSKQFKTKSAWRKLGVAFNVSVELVREEKIRGHRNRVEECETTVRATSPNGRHMDGVGVSSIYEKCCDPATCKLRETWDDGKPTGHVHCGELCNGARHFSNPAHDIPATAFTRASNRAQADLFGMGEVSAEEVGRNGDYGSSSESTGRTDTRRSTRRSSQPAEPAAPRPAAPAQLGRIACLLAEQGIVAESGPGEKLLLEIIPNHQDGEPLLFSEARIIIDTLEQRKATP